MMKKNNTWLQGFVLTSILMSTQIMAQETAAKQVSTVSSSPIQFKGTKTGIVNTKKCLEESKLGKQEQVNLEKKKGQMESILKEKESLLEEIESKLNDDDYMDSISDEAARELTRKKRQIRNEGMQLQNQYLRGLQEENMRIIKKLTDAIAKASTAIALDNPSGQVYDAIFTDEATTYYAPSLDVSEWVIKKMNEQFDMDQKK
jgi:outer membrane protein